MRGKRKESRLKNAISFSAVKCNDELACAKYGIMCVTLDVKGARVFEESDVMITKTNCRELEPRVLGSALRVTILTLVAREGQ